MFRPERASGELVDAVAKPLANAPSTLSYQGFHRGDMLVACSQSGENLVSARNDLIAIGQFGGAFCRWHHVKTVDLRAAIREQHQFPN
jgi:hypothetical protein